MLFKSSAIAASFHALAIIEGSRAFGTTTSSPTSCSSDRREFVEHLSKAAAALTGAGLFPQVSTADVDVEAFEKSGMVSMPMGVSGQAGKVCPSTF